MPLVLRSRRFPLLATLTLALSAPIDPAAGEVNPPATAERRPAWTNGPPATPDYFPIAVWLQDPKNAGRYRELGINLYVGLWKGPTSEQLAELARHGMAVICSRNEHARSRLDSKAAGVIVGWMHGDEPDNARSLGRGKGYGPPVDPAKIIVDYQAIRAADPTRPVLLNLGQGVAWDGWHGRGVRTNHPEDYERYVEGCDIASFDIYPAVHDRSEVAGKLWYVAKGVERLRRWTGGRKAVWNCIECTHIGNAQVKPAPAQVKAEVWMAIIHGSQGLIYFCHQFEPRFIEAALLEDPEMAAAVGGINRQVHRLAPVLNSPTLPDAVTVEVEPAEVSPELAQGLGPRPIATLAKQHGGALHVFAVRMEAAPANAKVRFRLPGLPARAIVAVDGEDRTLEAENGSFADDFGPHAVHIYSMPGAGSRTGPEGDLPRVLVIGDSISIGYTPHLRKLLAGKAVVERIGGEADPPVNGGDSANVLENLPAWAGGKKYDLIHFNCGLHDLKFDEARKTFQQPLASYEQNLRAIVAWGREHTRAKWVFASTTPVHDQRSRARQASFERYNRDVQAYNEVAAKVMKEVGVPITDLYRTVEEAGRDRSLSTDGVHFTPAAYELLAGQVAADIEKHLPEK